MGKRRPDFLDYWLFAGLFLNGIFLGIGFRPLFTTAVTLFIAACLLISTDLYRQIDGD